MKLWLTKFRISAALDSGKPLPEALQKENDANPELQQFARRAQQMDSLLREPQPAVSSQHDQIMRAVRASTRPEMPGRSPAFTWLATSGALVLFVLICLAVAHPRSLPRHGISMDAPLTVLDISEKMPATLPSEMLAPLTNELAKVNRDVQNTRDILASTLPFEIQ